MASVKEVKEVTINVPWGVIRGKLWNPEQCESNPRSGALLLHGVQHNAASFDRLVSLLPGHLPYLAIDLPGHGLSSHFPQGILLDFFNYIVAIKWVLKDRGWDSIILIAHSFGAQLGTFFTSLYPEKVTKYIALDALIPFMVPTPSTLDFMREKLDKLEALEAGVESRGRTYATYEEAVEKTMNSRQGRLERDEAVALLDRSLVKTDKGYQISLDPRCMVIRHSLWQTMKAEQVACFTDSLSCPILLVVASTTVDLYREFTGESLLEFLTNISSKKANLRIFFMNGDHMIHVNQVHIVAPLVSNFILERRSQL